ncbi:MAG: hypothetical protein FJ130_12310 [Deltaproteobacteria bacterium]|nr:hypothetical protein [Deltaproteobacteria bacterium]
MAHRVHPFVFFAMRYALCVMLRIGAKYCGGCNPSYERVAIVQRAQSRLKDRFLFLRHDEPDIEVMVLLSGCHRACANQDLHPTEISSYSVTGENDFKDLIDYLTSLQEKGDG